MHCIQCGNKILDEAKFCNKCGRKSNVNTDELKVEGINKVSTERKSNEFLRTDEEYGNFGLRLLAFIVDYAAITLVVIIFVLFTDYFWSEDIDTLVGWIFIVAYHTIFLTSYSSTPGKMLLGLRVVDEKDGAKINFGKSLGRTLSYIISSIFLLGFIGIAFNKKRQGWHDRIANTLVIRDKSKKLTFLSGIIVVISIILICYSFYYAYLDEGSNYSTEELNNKIVGQTNTPTELEELFDRNLKESVVNIFCSDKGEKVSLDNSTTGGSGTMITSDGIVLTNFHIFPYDYESSNYFPLYSIRCLVLLPEPELGTPQEMYIAKPMAIPDLNEKYDLIFLEIIDSFVDEDGVAYGDYPRNFSSYDNTACTGKGDPKLGERIRIFGYPTVSGGWSLTITDGLVSSFDDEGDIITSAKIDSGNSGGLAVDENDCIVGVPVAVAIGDYENLGKIISVNNVNNFLQEFKARNDLEQIFPNITFE